ncbi:hypothetical protein SZ55_1620 [Pseudomonas sp. FeS53a]|nr:hypothetical protein SZ55_1620 [Pseudomonas sp. FeS53a]
MGRGGVAQGAAPWSSAVGSVKAVQPSKARCRARADKRHATNQKRHPGRKPGDQQPRSPGRKRHRRQGAGGGRYELEGLRP